jgi:DMSO/TMAO reductase YedYZ molybdopterin-dependent catalytic subunit
LGLIPGIAASMISRAWGAVKRRVLPRGTPRQSLVMENPANLDTTNLVITPLRDFGTMGLSDHKVNLETWRLTVKGEVATPLNLSYRQILDLPSIEKNVLLICPGVFANNGAWKGVSIKELLTKARARRGVTHVIVRGPKNQYAKVNSFPIGDIMSDKVFLAYQVNGSRLPEKHGFPLRVVARDYYGYDWVKYVGELKVEKIRQESRLEGSAGGRSCSGDR